MDKQERLLFFTGIIRSIQQLFGNDLSLFKPLTMFLSIISKEKIYKVMMPCLDICKGVWDKDSNEIYSMEKHNQFFYID